MSYAGRLAIIAGGLGGLGSATGQALRAKGARLAILYAPFEASRKQKVLESVFGSANPEGISSFECDITSESSVDNAFGQITSETGSSALPSILVNAAGYVSVQALEETSGDEAYKNIVPNILGPFLCSKAFYKLYTSKGQGSRVSPPGRIVSIASQAAHVALWGHGPYCASKAGLISLTQCMASEWGSKGITANTVSPTVVWTELGKKAWADDEKREKHISQIPTGRFSVPEEIASAIEFLCRDDSGMINGADIRIDGGFTVSR